jgi:hypothetical protein
MGGARTVRSAPGLAGRDDAEEPAMRTTTKIFTAVAMAALFLGGAASIHRANADVRISADTPWGGGSITPNDTPWGGN